MSMHTSKTQSLCRTKPLHPAPPDLLSLLSDWIGRNGSRPAILIRALPERDELRSRNLDVDLLVTLDQARELLRLAFEDVQNGRCHVQIESRHRSKIQLILWTTDTSERLSVDLWLEWNQTLSRRVISASTLREIAERPTRDSDAILTGIAKFPADIELALLILHVVTKKRTVVSAINRRRLHQLTQRLDAGGSPPLDIQNLLTSVRNDLAKSEKGNTSSGISRRTGWMAEAVLLSRLKHCRHASPTLLNRAASAFTDGLMSAMRFAGRTIRKMLPQSQCPTLAFVGSDGSGKTSLTELVSAAHSGKWKTVVGRKLYRRSLVYSVICSVTRRVFRMSRSDFDDHLAPILSFRAMMVLWVMLFWLRVRNVFTRTKQGLVLDRSPESMLIIGRRLGKPVVARGSKFLEYFAPPLRQVLLLMPYAVLSNRKQELSSSSHEQYQQLLFEQMTRQPVVSTLLLSNSASPLAGLEALEVILELAKRSGQIAGFESAPPKTQTIPTVSSAFSTVQMQPKRCISNPGSEYRKDRAA